MDNSSTTKTTKTTTSTSTISSDMRPISNKLKEREQQQQIKRSQSRSALSSTTKESSTNTFNSDVSSKSSSSSDKKQEKPKISPSVVVNTKTKKGSTMSTMNDMFKSKDQIMNEAQAKASAIVAKAGNGNAFQGETLGIGGLNDVLAQIRRRVWVPLAAPPQLLQELGINPVRGLLLYGGPGCGKTLLARSIGKILSPMRPVTVVSGPEVMDRFVGSSEANLREIFDNPPDIYDTFRIHEKDDGKMLSKVTLHVIVFDEFDAMARSRGGKGGDGGDQGDAGVARDSVVNQMLAKMDGVDPLKVPTLVIGLTNKRSLIEPALLRPGRFEVQIEVPKPRTNDQRISILNVHMNSMFEAGRVYVSDSPEGSPSTRRLNLEIFHHDVPTYDELLNYIATKCDGMSGASLAGVTRAAASRALERAVFDFSGSLEQAVTSTQAAIDTDDGDFGLKLSDCLVTKSDFESAIEDVLESGKEEDDDNVDEERDT